jgi:hypothetical protein
MLTTESDSSPAEAPQSLDILAMLLSGLCLVHCIVLPALAALMPLFASEHFADERVHLWLLVAVVPTSLMALGFGYRHHRHHLLIACGLLGLGLVAFAALGRNAGAVGESGDRWFSVTGGIILALVHLRNFRLLHAIRHPHHRRAVEVAG